MRRAGASVLPAEGWQGPAPAFPLPDVSARELTVWCEAWSSPQAAAWVLEPWRHRTVALWCRLGVRAESTDSPAALFGQLTRLADQIGMTPAGLAENRWRIAEPGDAATFPARPEKRSRRSSSTTPAEPTSLAAARERRASSDPRGALHRD